MGRVALAFADGGPGAGWCTFLFTPAGEPALVYPDSVPNGSVIYAVGNGGSWNLEKIANGADSPSLAFTPAGEPAISCYNYGGSVDYFVRHEGAWNRFVVEEAGKDQAGQLTGPYTFTSLAISPALGASPAIAYYDRATGGIKCAIGTVSLGFRGAGVTSAVRDLLSLP